MAVFHLTKSTIQKLNETSFERQGLMERYDLQRLLKTHIEVVAPEVLIIAEEFCDWQDSKRRIDLLGVDRKGNLVVIELKRDTEGGHMDLQALRYAAMVSTMTFDDAVEQLQWHLEQSGLQTDARTRLLAYLGWNEPQEENFASDTRIVLVAADFGKEITTTVLWLNNEYGLDIRCVRMRPYVLDSHVLVDVQQILPLPEAQEYQIGLRKKSMVKRESIRQSGEPTGYWFMNIGDAVAENRSWDDRKKYGFMTAGGGKQWIDAIKKLRPDDHVFAYASGSGYVGLGRVLTEAVPFGEFRIGDGRSVVELPLKTPPKPEQINDPANCDWCVGVQWLAALDRENGALKGLSYRGTLCQIRQRRVVDELLEHFGVEPANSGANRQDETPQWLP